jgi:hypothetical protein
MEGVMGPYLLDREHYMKIKHSRRQIDSINIVLLTYIIYTLV